MEKNSTENMLRFIEALDFQQIPENAVKAAKNTILDWIGVTIAAKDEALNKIGSDYIKQLKSVGEASVVGGGFKTSAEYAAWLNGMNSHALDYDTTYSHGYNMHPTIVVLPGVLALGEKYHLSGQEVLTAYIGGIEALARICDRIGESNSRAGWHPTCVLGTAAAEIACGKILKLDLSQLKNALGIACSLSGGLRENFGTMTKPMHAGNAAKNGVIAALLARSGFTANENITDGQYGFYNMFGNGKVEEVADDELGKRWDIVAKGITFKLYPCCRGTHPGVDASLSIFPKLKKKTDHIKSITCRTSPFVPRTLIHHNPTTELEAKFSLEYCVSSALVRGKIAMDSFKEEVINDPRIQSLIPKVKYSHPEGWPSGISLTQEVVVTLNDGTEYSCKVINPKGDPKNPISEDDLLNKFRDCASGYLKPLKIEKVIKTVNNLETLDDISGLMALVL